MVHVKDAQGFKGKNWMADGIWLTGIFQIQTVESEYGSAGFRINDAVLKPLSDDALLLEETEMTPLEFDPNDDGRPIL
jgi:hypothetical protein